MFKDFADIVTSTCGALQLYVRDFYSPFSFWLFLVAAGALSLDAVVLFFATLKYFPNLFDDARSRFFLQHMFVQYAWQDAVKQETHSLTIFSWAFYVSQSSEGSCHFLYHFLVDNLYLLKVFL